MLLLVINKTLSFTSKSTSATGLIIHPAAHTDRMIRHEKHSPADVRGPSTLTGVLWGRLHRVATFALALAHFDGAQEILLEFLQRFCHILPLAYLKGQPFAG